ncbi:hypothetical protein FOQG_13693 [Fusarium oxysporum f. sp. raphani 54005]|uniref:Enoyl-CoA hydratase n=2 Tax=Fusarium oxysporum f. sp. raphani TaxID=96318 RepID=X0BTW0_FUSOX|nr:hypothetical protein FOQG_13693 [Fusarium oxysporum f. sp. raphani 54005]KAG7434396.1 Enoyl-CoA delta isomerase 3 [Fusarium oxysporum f. sp. raphani]
MHQNLGLERRGDVFILTLQKPPENRLTSQFCQEIIRALNDVRRTLGPDAPGAVIIRGNDAKFFCRASSEGSYPLVATLLHFPFPTICLITGHTFGGASVMTLAHDYRIMNDTLGYWCTPVAELGLHFDGMGALLRAKLPQKIARKVILQGHKFTSSEALADGIVDEIASPEEMLNCALQLANRAKSKAKIGVYGLLKGELYGEALRAFQQISYVHSRLNSRQAKVKL